MAPSSLTFLSWNLALLEISAQAPVSWQTHHTEEAIRRTILELGPDVVAFQELPAMVPYVESHDMVRANPRSHSGHLATLITHELMAAEPFVTTVPGTAVLTTIAEPAITVANVHLIPGRGAGSERLAQLAAVVEASPTEAVLIVGDTNTRVEEVEAITTAGFHSTKPPRATWNSRRNRFRPDGAQFSAYFTRWFAGPGVTVSDVRVLDRPEEVDGATFHLSDHFAIAGTVEVTG
ncbi:MAG: endonuclease/exonuclease/phosphatase family protein [Actinomycetota bacterium]